MRELIIKVDDPGERAWDGSSKVFEIKELVRCKDCKHYAETQQGKQRKINRRYACDEFNTSDDWFCADGER